MRPRNTGNRVPRGGGHNYRLNPGEAWAETYRLLGERRSGAIPSTWNLVDPSFHPDEAALAAAERDVLEPWPARHRLSFQHRFPKTGERVWSVAVATPLDGTIQVSASLPRGGRHDLELLDAERRVVLATGLWGARRTKGLTTTVCGRRSVVVRVTRTGAPGRVAMVASVP